MEKSIKYGTMDVMKKSSPLSCGFTILELSVVVAVIALIAGTALAVGATRIQAAKIEDTNDKMDALLDVIDNFVKTYGYLPCPADPSASPTDDAGLFGVGLQDVDTSACVASNLRVNGNTVIGVVPTATLNVAPSLMMDGWNRRITYAVDQRFTNATTYASTDPDTDATGGFMTIYSSTSPAVVVTDKAVMVLISHGANGHGAWRAAGGAALDKDSTDVDEQENANLETVDSAFVQKFLTETYDDITYYRMKWQFPEVEE